ncbi:MAG: flagellar hook-basal body protein [Verrucomicrobiota bacterium]
MNIGLYQNAASLSALERWQDSVAQNIASSQMTGYRKRTVNFSALAAGEVQSDGRANAAMGHGVSSPMLFPKVNSGISFPAGVAQPTRRDLDVAIQGEGFFEVQRADGSRAYTRSGEFRIRPDRTLITSAGDTVLSQAGAPFVLLADGGSVAIDSEGVLSQSGTALGKLSVQTFSDPAQLTPLPGGLYAAPAGAAPAPATSAELRQGYLEGSNVTPMREMADLILISRAYEANQKIISTVDQRIQKTLEALG